MTRIQNSFNAYESNGPCRKLSGTDKPYLIYIPFSDWFKKIASSMSPIIFKTETILDIWASPLFSLHAHFFHRHY